MKTDYADKQYLKDLQKENMPLRSLMIGLSKAIPYIVGTGLVYCALAGGISYISNLPREANPEHSQLVEKLDKEKKFNQWLYDSGAQRR